ncbi:phosphotransferase [Nocardioides humilatus]|uniref:Phosphotransferase n=1 Tax=Nocardioides humilatus TaxID=2607660 RepID=A0A5B1LEQ3_9ACTN|nr:phosphotransferase [Nocardioides humilatus]KAA1418688.1 phosphotransferase [Nocardioides humilatus]
MAAGIDRAVLDSAIARAPVSDDGRSGAALERVLLATGEHVIVKRYDASVDLVMQMCGDTRGREVALYLDGVLDDLPPTVRHPILDAWYDDGHGVVVMRDLGDSVLTWEDRLSAAQVRHLLSALADLHAAHAGRTELTETSLDLVVGLFQPDRIRAYAGAGLIDAALRGWEHFAEVAPGDVGRQVLALAHDVTPLVRALEDCTPTLLHSDVATVNVAMEADGITLIDWGLASVGPAEMDVARLLVGCGHLFDVSFDEFLDIQREVAGTEHDETALDLALLAGLTWLGWNKSLDIVEHDDPATRARERAGLDWWLAQAARAFERGLV